MQICKYTRYNVNNNLPWHGIFFRLFLFPTCISKPSFASFGHPTVVTLCQRYANIIEQMAIGCILKIRTADSR